MENNLLTDEQKAEKRKERMVIAGMVMQGIITGMYTNRMSLSYGEVAKRAIEQTDVFLKQLESKAAE